MFSTKVFLFVVFVSSLTASSYGQANAKFFKKGYKYLEDTQSFYKIHTLHKKWPEAKQRCAMEGAMLFHPQDKDEADAVIEYWNKTQPNFNWIHVGVSALQVKGVFESVDGIPIEDLYDNWGVGEPNDANNVEDCVGLNINGWLNDHNCEIRGPYICKKALATLEWNSLCDMPDPTYNFNPELGKCYKVHLNPMNWTDAFIQCHAEQSHLAIINSQLEADYMVKLLTEAPKDKAKGDQLGGAVYLGFHNRDNTGWHTIKAIPIEESGYTRWGDQKPDGSGNELCGSMFYTGQLNAVACHHRGFFICEHEIAILGHLNERDGVIN